MAKRKMLFISFLFTMVMVLPVLFADKTASAQSPAPMKPMMLIFNGGTLSDRAPEAPILIWFGDEVAKQTKGLLTFTYRWSNSITRPGQELDAVRTRLCHLSVIPEAYYPDKLFLNNYSYAIPFTVEDAITKYEIFAELFDKMPALGAEWEKYGHKLLMFDTVPEYGLQSTVPIRTLADFKGKKIAISGVYAPKLVEATGAVPLNTNIPDRASQLQTGMIQGSILSLAVARPFAYHEYAKYYTSIDLGALIGAEVTINLELFNSFPKDVQSIIVEVGKETSKRIAQANKKAVDGYIAKMKAEGVTFYPFPDEEKEKWAKLMGDPVALWIKDGEAKGLPARELAEKFIVLNKKAGHKFPKGLSSMTD